MVEVMGLGIVKMVPGLYVVRVTRRRKHRPTPAMRGLFWHLLIVAYGRRRVKIHVDIDCTPDEARTMFGLPDLKPMQNALMGEIENRLMKAMTAMEPDALVKMWLPASISGLEQWQKFVWSRLTGGRDEGEGKDG